ncbi:helix-turn-helix domain-containing protein [Kiloniella majae]|uniref:helix-turn-helix domain-containing protein n=1 Tax=Kiloniella majae TaxID=1938558 RepID=UPI000A2789CE|nr:AraC family transcriptional regulator [Kiloniella majae]
MANVVIHNLEHQKIEKLDVPNELSSLFEYFWKVTWDVPDAKYKVQKILTEPKADIYIEQDSGIWKLSEIRRTIFEYKLAGQGAVFGIKLRPASQYMFLSGGDDISLRHFPAVNFDSDFESIVVAINDYLFELSLSVTREMRLVNQVLGRLSGVNRLNSVTEVLDEFDVEPRQIQRLFQKHIGLSLKWIICRYRSLEAVMLSKEQDPDWRAIAYDLGYSDQSHFIRDFKENCGMTPNDYNRLYRESIST